MKKFLIFLALAMAFILLTSGLAIGRKAAEDEPAESSDVTTATTVATTEAPVIQEGFFYTVDGTSYTDEQLRSITDGTYVYFVEGGVMRFARVFSEYGTVGCIDFCYQPSAVSEYEGSYCYKFLKDDGTYHIADNFDLYRVPYDCYGGDPMLNGTGRVVAVFLELTNCSDPASVLSKFVGNTEFCSNANCADPETPEGPSADVTPETTTEVTTAPPQVDVPWPEEPGAE